MSLKINHKLWLLRYVLIVCMCLSMVFNVVNAVVMAQPTEHSVRLEAGHQHNITQSSFIQAQTNNIWPQLINQLAFTSQWQKQPEVQAQIRWLLRNRTLLNRMLSNSKYFLYYVFQQTQRYHLPAEFALLPMIESNYDPYAYSYAGASGLWQMMPGTGLSGNLLINWWYDGRADILTSTAAAMSYLQARQNSFHNWLYSLASYNAGAGAVAKSIRRNRAAGKSTIFWSLPLSRQTRDYVPRLIALAVIISHPSRYGVTLPYIPNQPYFSSVTINKQLSLLQISKWSGTDLQTIHILNPGFRRWASPPFVNSIILLPTDSLSVFNKNFQKNQRSLPGVNWIYHQARSTESLASIAANYRTSTQLLQRVNGLVGDKLIPNQGLLVPLHLSHIQSRLIVSNDTINQNNVTVPVAHKIQYRILADDSISTIASRYHVTTDQIRYWNHMQSNQTLQVGQSITMWVIGMDQAQWQQSQRRSNLKSSDGFSFHAIIGRLAL